jgi:hypothetical protein
MKQIAEETVARQPREAMGAVKSIAVETAGTRDLALIDGADGVWIVVPLRWWLSTFLLWLFLPAERRARVKLKVQHRDDPSTTVSVTMRAVRVASRHIRIRGRVDV